MYFNSETVRATRLAALDGCQMASNILIESAARIVGLYRDAGNKALGLARTGSPQAEPTLLGQIGHDLLAGHWHIVGHAHREMVHITTGQMHSTGNLAKFALDKTALMSPPMLEIAIDTAEAILATGENVASELGNATVNAVIAVEQSLDGSPRARRKNRK